MKNILVVLFVAITIAGLVPVQRAQATFHIPDINICNIAPQLCQVSPSVTPSISPAPSSAPTVAPTITPDVTVVPTATVEATVTPVPATNTGGDGKSDGRSDGLCSKPPCVPFAPPATGHGR